MNTKAKAKPKAKTGKGVPAKPTKTPKKPTEEKPAENKGAAKKEPEDKLITDEELAQIYGITTRRIHQIEQDGVIKSEPKKNNKEKRTYKFARSIVNLGRFWREKADSRRSGDSEDMESEKLQLTAAKREIEELKLAELKGDLHKTNDIERVMGAAVSRLRINLLAIPMGVAPVIRDKKNVNEIAEIINDRICRAMNEMANINIEKLLEEEKFFDLEDEGDEE